jgi:hypothetical protein
MRNLAIKVSADLWPEFKARVFCDGHVRAFSFFGGVPQPIL